MKFFSLSFSYHGPESHSCSEAGADAALQTAEFAVEKVLTSAGLNFRHAYCWPDGSLYKWVRCDDEDQVRRIVFPDGVALAELHEVDPGSNPHKPGFSTLAEYFEPKQY